VVIDGAISPRCLGGVVEAAVWPGLLCAVALLEAIAWTLAGGVRWAGSLGLGFGVGAATISELQWSAW
jgi:hypothetical protein